MGISRVYEEMGEKIHAYSFPKGHNLVPRVFISYCACVVRRSSQKGFVEVFNMCQKLIRPFPNSKNP